MPASDSRAGRSGNCRKSISSSRPNRKAEMINWRRRRRFAGELATCSPAWNLLVCKRARVVASVELHTNKTKTEGERDSERIAPERTTRTPSASEPRSDPTLLLWPLGLVAVGQFQSRARARFEFREKHTTASAPIDHQSPRPSHRDHRLEANVRKGRPDWMQINSRSAAPNQARSGQAHLHGQWRQLCSGRTLFACK